jgi:hypothetical protein
VDYYCPLGAFTSSFNQLGTVNLKTQTYLIDHVCDDTMIVIKTWISYNRLRVHERRKEEFYSTQNGVNGVDGHTKVGYN